MDWLRQIPIGQYVDGAAGWLRQLDPRLKLSWVLMSVSYTHLTLPTTHGG